MVFTFPLLLFLCQQKERFHRWPHPDKQLNQHRNKLRPTCKTFRGITVHWVSFHGETFFEILVMIGSGKVESLTVWGKSWEGNWMKNTMNIKLLMSHYWKVWYREKQSERLGNNRNAITDWTILVTTQRPRVIDIELTWSTSVTPNKVACFSILSAHPPISSYWASKCPKRKMLLLLLLLLFNNYLLTLGYFLDNYC